MRGVYNAFCTSARDIRRETKWPTAALARTQPPTVLAENGAVTGGETKPPIMSRFKEPLDTCLPSEAISDDLSPGHSEHTLEEWKPMANG